MKLKKYKDNPILQPLRENSWESGAVFNPGSLYKNGKVHLLYRAVGEYKNYISCIGYATSLDGFNFTRESVCPVLEPQAEYNEWGIEDPRIVELEGKVYITYVSFSKPALTEGKLSYTVLVSTENFHRFKRIGIIVPKNIDDRDTVLFPERIRGRYIMLHRPQEWTGSDYREWKSHNPSSIWLAISDNLKNWGQHRVLMKPEEEWEFKKIGIGPSPIKTAKGWLLIYHGVDKDNIYRVGAAMLDLNDPTKVIGRTKNPIMEPEERHEREGDIPNVVFPTGAVVIDNVLYVYYGAADKVICLATCDLDDLVNFLLNGK